MRVDEDTILIARTIATIAHLGQVDKAGEPYIAHPEAVVNLIARMVDNLSLADSPINSYAVATAWLHDVLEDTEVTKDELARLGVPAQVINAVELLTRTKNVSDEDYYATIRSSPLARLVKLADIRHNTDPRRLAKLDEPTQLRLIRKYAKAMEALA